MSFVGSSINFTEYNTDTQTQVLEQRMHRKSRKVAFFIPTKAELLDEELVPEVPSLDVFLYSDAPALHFYRNEYTRTAVIDFFVSLTGSEEIALSAMYFSNKYDIPFVLSFSLMHTESRFLPDAVNYNETSIDRGVFQLNNLAFPHLEESDFFNSDLNVEYGVSHLDWCFRVSSSLEEALAIYNAGYGKVKRGDIPDSTREYIRKILAYREDLVMELEQYLIGEIPERVLSIAAAESGIVAD